MTDPTPPLPTTITLPVTIHPIDTQLLVYYGNNSPYPLRLSNAKWCFFWGGIKHEHETIAEAVADLAVVLGAIPHPAKADVERLRGVLVQVREKLGPFTIEGIASCIDMIDEALGDAP